jgi:acyl-CoA reductase-like NAD-dependent aldehyde dehydrogenase
METLKNYIDGQFVSCPRHLDGYNPATGKVFLKIPDSGKEEVDHAVEAAKRALKTWAKTPVKERGRIMNKIADIVESRIDEFAAAESRDQGKPVWLAKLVDIPRVCHNFRFYASACQHIIDMSTILPEVGAMNYTCRQPVGVAGLISPWNLPLYLLSFKIAPAIGNGCTVVCKPSEFTSLTAHMLAAVMSEAGLPAGVCNIVYGTGPRAGEPLVTHPDVPLISFTGSTATGVKIQTMVAPYCKKLSLELGGKNAGIVFDDVDMNKCLPVMIRSSFINQGEVCLTTSRIFVQQNIYDTFVKRYVELAKNVKVGDPEDSDNMLGAINSKEHYEKIKSYIDKAKQEGCTIHCGLEEIDLPDNNKHGYFIRPTVITNVSDESSLMTDEIFGPVTCIVPFTTEEEVMWMDGWTDEWMDG